MEEVDAMFNALQMTQRSYEQQLNTIKYNIESEVNKRNANVQSEYNNALAAYRAEMKALREALHEYKIKERERIGRLKIVVPNELEEIYEYLNSLGKEK
jgi:phage host-nuclease inhibitor protein Gam